MSMPCSRMARTALGCSGLGWLPALNASIAPPASCSTSASAICERALLPVHRNSTRGRAGTGAPPTLARRCRRQPQAGMQRAAGRRQQLPAARQVEAVVGVAPIGRAAPHRHQPLGPQPPQVVGDQALRSSDQGAQLAHLSIAAPELAQQPPAQRVPGQPHEARRRDIRTPGRRGHPLHDTSIQFDRHARRPHHATSALRSVSKQQHSSRTSGRTSHPVRQRSPGRFARRLTRRRAPPAASRDRAQGWCRSSPSPW